MTSYVGDLPNRNPNVATRSSARLDPYWDGMWETSSSAAWWTREAAMRATRAGLVSSSSRSVPTDRDEALHAALTGRDRQRRFAMVAAVNLWRTMTTQQLSALIGFPLASKRTSADVRLLWSAGLLDRGEVSTLGYSRYPDLVRANSRGGWDQLYERLSFEDWVGITAGQPWRWGSQYDRHNVLATELGLRAAELTNIPLVLGEHLSTVNVVAPPGVTVNAAASNRGADLMLVRGDGLKVMVEMTYTTRGLAQKAQRWADTLVQDETGALAVLFVHVPHPEARERMDHKSITTAVREASGASMSHVLAGVPQRMMVVSWRDWFPESMEVDDSFVSLVARRPTGPDGDRWQDVAILDPFDLAGPGDDPEATAVLRNAAHLYGVPHWMRSAPTLSATQLWAQACDVPGLPRLEGMPPTPQQRAG